MQLARHANQWRVLLCGALVVSALLAASTARASCYVKTVATGAADGSSWANATTLQGALTSGCSALFLAQGVYKPTMNPANRGASFSVANKSVFTMWGGFPPDGGSQEQYDPVAYPTILSGDIDSNDDDGNADGNFITESHDEIVGNNSYHVLTVTNSGLVGIQGITVTGGLANASASDHGGGIRLDNVDNFYALDLQIVGNSASGDGGGVYQPDGHADFEASTVSGNFADAYGGGINMEGNYSLKLRDCTVSDNESSVYGGGISSFGSTMEISRSNFSGNIAAGIGGAIFAVVSVEVIDSLFSGNSAGTDGGAIATSEATIRNSTLSGNSAARGGGIWGGEWILEYSTITGNSASDTGGGVYGKGSIHASVIANSPAGGDCTRHSSGPIHATSSWIEDGGACINGTNEDNFSGDPLLDGLADNGGPTLTHLPLPGSPVVDRGGACAGQGLYDQRGVARPQGMACDIGAVEVAIGRPDGCFVAAAATGDNSGGDWTNAYTDLQLALRDVSCRTVKVAAGVYRPSNDPEDREATFILDRAITLQGGYPAAGGADPDPFAHPTVLSGDLGQDDTTDSNGVTQTHEGITGSNSYHVLALNHEQAEDDGENIVVMDGFVVTGGLAMGSGSQESGAGIQALAGIGEFSHMRIVGNRAALAGAGINNAAALQLRHSTISGNHAGTHGGGVYNNGTLELGFSTLSGNSATSYGGGGFNNGTLFTIQSTLSGNQAGLNGGGIYNNDVLSLTYATVLDNSAAGGGGGLLNTGTAILSASVIADNGGGDCSRTNGLIGASTTLIGDGLACVSQLGIDNLSGDPLLGDRADNGGDTLTHLPLPGSPLLELNKDCIDTHPVDQRGIGRFGRCDSGAVEARLYGLSVLLDGPGTVTPDAIPINSLGLIPTCPTTDCDWVYPEAGVVTLSATGDAGWEVGRWSGDCTFDPDSLQATVILDQNVVCTAHFTTTVVLLPNPVVGGAIATLNGVDPAAVPHDTALSLVATPSGGWDVANPDSGFTPSIQCLSGTQELDLTLQGDGSGLITTPPITESVCTITAYFANQPPGFTVPVVDVSALVDGAAVTLPGWATDLRSGDAPGVVGQPMQFLVTAEGVTPAGAQVVVGNPFVSADGTLHFTPGPDAGTASFSVVLADAAGTANGGSDSTIPEPLRITTAAVATDLSISADVPATLNFPGEHVVLGISVANAGPAAADDAHVQWSPPSSLANVAWICAPQGAATCSASGTGAINDSVALPIDGRIDYLIEADLPPAGSVPEAPIPSSASVVPGTGQADPENGNNSASWLFRIDGLFRDGLESTP